MPYIKRAVRLAFECPAHYKPADPGQLNYLITKIVRDYAFGGTNGLSYQKINDVLGALEGAKLEFYRRVVAPYENAKMAENGDVYE
jgi:hypothetical protein